MNRSESDEQYRLVGQEALMWLEKAQGLRYCAEMLNTHLLEDLINSPPASRRVEMNGVVSFYRCFYWGWPSRISSKVSMLRETRTS